MCYQGSCTQTDCDNQNPVADFCDPSGSSCVVVSAMDTHPLHCGGCNSTCARDEVCVEGGCETYYPATPCTSCPCSACGSDLCCGYPGPTDIVCVQGGVSACP